MKFALVSAITALLVCGCSSDGGRIYSVSLTRRAKVGDTYRITSAGTASSSAVGAGLPLKTEKYDWEFAAVAEVVELDEAGAPSRIACKVEKCVDKASVKQELLPKGYELVIVMRGGVCTFPFDRPLPPEDAQLAVAALLTVGEAGVDLDALFGGAPRRVGEKWPVADMAGSEISGQAKVKRLRKVAEIECLDVEMAVELRGVLQSVEWTLGGDTVITVEADMQLPTDPALPILEITWKSTMTVDSPGPPGQEASGSFKSTSETRVTTRVQPLE